LVVRIIDEPARLFRPALADERVGCEATQGLQATCEAVGCEGGEMLPELVVVFVVEAVASSMVRFMCSTWPLVHHPPAGG
jgi:hypothetical protein